MPIAASGGFTLVAEVVADDSDKTFIVPAGAQWSIVSIYVLYVSTATAGNRLVTVQVTDENDNVVVKYVAGAVQTASLSVTYVFAPLHPQETTMANNAVQLRAISDRLLIPAGWKLRVFDSAAIAVAADDMTVRIIYHGATV